MRVLIAFDKFKDAIDARAACAAAAGALRARHPDWSLDLCPLSDGGDGFARTLTEAAGGTLERVEVTGPRGALVTAPIGMVAAEKIPAGARQLLGLADGASAADSRATSPGSVAVVDLASASGLALLAANERDPWQTTTLGTGQLLAAAAARRPAAIVLGVGGSATNDLATGALAALGLRFFDAFATELPPLPARWADVARVEGRPVLPPLFIACDVRAPLVGKNGATFVFGTQKGLQECDTRRLDAACARMAGILCSHFNRPPALVDQPGAGAAGGAAFGLMAGGNGRIVPGFDFVSAWLGLPARLATADLVITGEGRFDATSLGGKATGMLATLARRLGKRAVIFAGSLGVPEDTGHRAITPAEIPLTEALPRTAEFLAAAVAGTF